MGTGLRRRCRSFFLSYATLSGAWVKRLRSSFSGSVRIVLAAGVVVVVVVAAADNEYGDDDGICDGDDDHGDSWPG